MTITEIKLFDEIVENELENNSFLGNVDESVDESEKTWEDESVDESVDERDFVGTIPYIIVELLINSVFFLMFKRLPTD